MDYRKINFDAALNMGPEAYNRSVGRWWLKQSSNAVHAYAYRKIAQHINGFISLNPKRIVDYACGAGHMLWRLYWLYPESRLLGIDGSALLLKRARQRLQILGKDWKMRTDLVETYLPNFSLPTGLADLCLFVFPNIIPNGREENKTEHNFSDSDLAVAKYLSEARESNPDEETVRDDPETVYDFLLNDNIVARNLRGLLRKGGVCLRADYSNAPRDELTRLVRERLAFEEGSLAVSVNGYRAKQLFKVVSCNYYRSRVLEDVYHQTKNADDKRGGYFITTLKAV